MWKCSNGERYHRSRNFNLTKNNSAKMPNFQILIYKLKNPLKHLSFSPSLLLVYYYIRYMCIIAMHWLHRPSRRAKVEQRVSSWSGGQMCYQVALGIALKLVPDFSFFLAIRLGLKNSSTSFSTTPSVTTTGAVEKRARKSTGLIPLNTTG